MLSSNYQLSVDPAPDEQIYSPPASYKKNRFDLCILKFISAGSNYTRTSMTNDAYLIKCS